MTARVFLKTFTIFAVGILILSGMLIGQTTEKPKDVKPVSKFDPKVTVTLDKAMNTRFSVMGNVATPGVRVMDRKVSIYEAVLDAGGVTKNGDKNKVYVVSYTRDGHLDRKLVSLAQMETGKAQ